MEMYKARYYALDGNGEELFCRRKYFSSKMKALDWLRTISATEMQTDARSGLYRDCDLYCHITEYEESEGAYNYYASAVYSCVVQGEGYKCFEGTKKLLTSF